MSAISGPKMVDEPAPITACTSVKTAIDGASDASAKPAASTTEAISAGIQ